MTYRPTQAPPPPAGPMMQYAAPSGKTCHAAPVNTVLPVVSNAYAGQNAAVTNGTWTGDPTITYQYQWYKQGVLLSGQTASTYAIPSGSTDVGKSLLALVKATNSVASSYALSNGATIATDPTADPLFSSVLLLLHGEGTNGSTTFTDTSSHAFAQAALSGGPTVSTAQAKYGSSSILLPSNAYVRYSNAALVIPANAAFCLETWIYITAINSYKDVAKVGTEASNRWLLGIDATNKLFMNVYGGATSNFATLTLTTGWHHVAFDRSASSATVRAFWDGVQVGTASNSAQVGNNGDYFVSYSGAVTGYQDDHRFTSASRYTANFTPSSVQFPDH